MRSMAATSALASTGSSRARAREVVRVGLGVDLDVPVVGDLGVQHVRAAAEAHDVEDVDVLAQLAVGDLQALVELGRVEQHAAAARPR